MRYRFPALLADNVAIHAVLKEKNKAGGLGGAVNVYRLGESDPRYFKVEPEAFRQAPGAPSADKPGTEQTQCLGYGYAQ